MRKLLIILPLFLAACADPAIPKEKQADYEICVERGLQYFKGLKNWPYIDDAQSYKVTDHVTSKCASNTGNFGPTKQAEVTPAGQEVAEVR